MADEMPLNMKGRDIQIYVYNPKRKDGLSRVDLAFEDDLLTPEIGRTYTVRVVGLVRETRTVATTGD